MLCRSFPSPRHAQRSTAHKIHAHNVSLRSKRLNVAKALKIADIYVDEEAFHYVCQLDFRGRVYCMPSFNPQGDDVTKGMLTFADGMAINDGVAAGWLAIQGANVYGEDKIALEDRIQWVEDNEQEILSCAADPLGATFWHKADKPWQFLAFCFEWAGFLEEGYGYVSHLPVALDGSCSGIQHFSAMLLDEEGGGAVNLIPAEKPEDIYQIVCDKVMVELRQIVSASMPIGNSLEKSSTIAPSYSYSEATIPPKKSLLKLQLKLQL